MPPDQVHPPGPGKPPRTRYTLLGPGTHPRDQVHPPGPDTPPGADTPRTRYPPPRAEHAGRYGQRAGGPHPTGMQSCLVQNFKLTVYPFLCFRGEWEQTALYRACPSVRPALTIRLDTNTCPWKTKHYVYTTLLMIWMDHLATGVPCIYWCRCVLY